MNNTGLHVLCDLYLKKMPSTPELLGICEDAIKESGMTIISCSFKLFDPEGMTAVWILSESHFTVHTYPEKKYITIDCYTCGKMGRPDLSIKHTIKKLRIKRKMIKIHKRGNF